MEGKALKTKLYAIDSNEGKRREATKGKRKTSRDAFIKG